jgi:hypothetical protein
LLHCYAIEKVTIENIRCKKPSSISRRNTAGSYSQVQVRASTILMGGGGLEAECRFASEDSPSIVESFNKTGNLAAIKRRKGNYTSLVSSRAEGSVRKRREQVRQHFSNFYN